MRSLADLGITPAPWILPSSADSAGTPRDEGKSVSAQPDPEIIRAEGRAQGVREGYQAAEAEYQKRLEEIEAALAEEVRQEREQAEARLQAQLALFQQAEAQVRERADQWLQALEDNVLAISLAVARHLVQREVEADPTLLRDLVRSAVAQLGPVASPVRVRVHPSDLEALQAGVEEDGGTSGFPMEMEWVADATIAQGGCVVEMAQRIIDGDVASALESMYRTLRHA